MCKNNCYLFDYWFQEFVYKKQFLDHLVHEYGKRSHDFVVNVFRSLFLFNNYFI